MIWRIFFYLQDIVIKIKNNSRRVKFQPIPNMKKQNKSKANAYSTLTHSVIIPRCVCKYDKAAYYVGSMYFNMIFQKIKNKLAFILA